MIPLGWIDPWRMSIEAYRERGSLVDHADGTRGLRLLSSKWQHPRWDKMGPFKAGIARARKASAAVGMEVVEAKIEALDPGVATDWELGHKDDAIVHVALVTNPGCWLYEGGQSLSLAPGHIVLLGNGPFLRSAANHGETQRLHLVLVLRKEAEEPS